MQEWVLLFFLYFWLAGALWFLFQLGQIASSFLKTLKECERAVSGTIAKVTMNADTVLSQLASRQDKNE